MAVTVSPLLIPIVRTVLYAMLVICGFTVAIAVSMSKYDNNCLLYADLTNLSFGSESTCNYNIAIATVFCLLYPITVIIINVICIGKNIIMPYQELPFLIHVVADGVAFFFVLVAACTISVGFKMLCDSFVGDSGFSCSSMAEGTDETKEDYQNLSAAETAVKQRTVKILQTAKMFFKLTNKTSTHELHGRSMGSGHRVVRPADWGTARAVVEWPTDLSALSTVPFKVNPFAFRRSS
ncbi:transmembrane protein 179B-like isoform X1 [Haliotis rufescens]|uniref:transmembrane protein 179B-like isoform X1 n=1 Tax=Haliotis rufescens TaxID=6454 RepID=UPI00201F05FD|nr:transmembrane protein 179B-like isoform X1 [Haliotis rufescens]